MSNRIGIESLARAVRILGGQNATAVYCGVGQSAISECLRNGKAVPAEWCPRLDVATRDRGQRISCHELRSDLWSKDYVPPRESEAA